MARSGKHEASTELFSAQDLLAFQRSVGNAPTAALVQRQQDAVRLPYSYASRELRPEDITNDVRALKPERIEDLIALYLAGFRLHRVPATRAVFSREWVLSDLGSALIAGCLREKLTTKTDHPRLQQWFARVADQTQGIPRRRDDVRRIIREAFERPGETDLPPERVSETGEQSQLPVIPGTSRLSVVPTAYPLRIPALPKSYMRCAEAPDDDWAGLPQVEAFALQLAALYREQLPERGEFGLRQTAMRRARTAERREGESDHEFRHRRREAVRAAGQTEIRELRTREHVERFTHLKNDFRSTIRVAKNRPLYQRPGSLHVVAAGWMIGMREMFLFQTQMTDEQGRDIPRVNISPGSTATAPDREPLTVGRGPDVDPRLNRFLEALDRVHPGLRFSNYHKHGGGEWRDRGLSIDITVPGGSDSCGFFDPESTADALRSIHQTAAFLGASWRVLYNDFRVARTINRECGAQHVRFGGSPGRRLNWHGPLVLHLHLDYQPPNQDG